MSPSLPSGVTFSPLHAPSGASVPWIFPGGAGGTQPWFNRTATSTPSPSTGTSTSTQTQTSSSISIPSSSNTFVPNANSTSATSSHVHILSIVIPLATIIPALVICILGFSIFRRRRRRKDRSQLTSNPPERIEPFPALSTTPSSSSEIHPALIKSFSEKGPGAASLPVMSNARTRATRPTTLEERLNTLERLILSNVSSSESEEGGARMAREDLGAEAPPDYSPPLARNHIGEEQQERERSTTE
ncbi:hypothetical protein CPB84DRAFT_1788250 [Gymnopilus junonius]|uniref:Uncharacterized protein n=1 Tax=Gymnopilus junonius TaxID=109634 RepID=A0A9P5NG15_GYMJU|nr:hypothetical protein CPB84DRAFT_1788250 [Gymnopilus junonius]